MVRKLVSFILLSVLALQLISIFTPYTVIDPKAAKYDEQFLEYVKKYCKEDQYLQPIQKSIYFDSLPSKYAGVCFTNSKTKLTIIYNGDHWESFSEDMKFSTAMHESMHCYFDIKHSKDPTHFMYFEENNLTQDEVVVQLEELLKRLCN